MIDLHCHLLPGIDDGPKTMDESIAMFRHAADSGINKVITTPHITPGRYDNSFDTIQPVFEKVSEQLKQNNIDIRIAFAAEVRYDHVILEMVNDNAIPFIGEYEREHLILLEFPHTHIPPGYEELIKWLSDKGVRAMIAHPERNRSLSKDINRVESLVKLGCLLQITGGSITGVFSDTSRQCAEELLKKGWVSVIASDAHNLHARAPELEPARLEAEKIVGEAAANSMVFDLPEAITRIHFQD